MEPTRHLARVVQQLRAVHHVTTSARFRLQLATGDVLQVEEHPVPRRVLLTYFTGDPAGAVAPDLELVCGLNAQGRWIPLEFMRRSTGRHLYGQLDGDGHLRVTDIANQQALARYCDVWAFHLVDQGWLEATLVVEDLPSGASAPRWPTPTTPEPGVETLEAWLWEDGGCEATDGCWVELDGRCPHGHPSWLLRLGWV
jgi:hypothetical protein